jgi:hypothetical protein
MRSWSLYQSIATLLFSFSADKKSLSLFLQAKNRHVNAMVNNVRQQTLTGSFRYIVGMVEDLGMRK